MEGKNQCNIPFVENKTKGPQRRHSSENESSKRYGRRRKFIRCCRENLLTILTIVGVLVGIVVGFVVKPSNPSTDTTMLLSFPGEIFMRMLRMLIAPLIIGSLVSGMASLDPKNSGKLALRATVYCLVTTFAAIIPGIVAVFIIHPGDPDSKDTQREPVSLFKEHPPSSQDSLLDVIRNIFPRNIIQACFQQTKTKYVKKTIEVVTTAPSNASFSGSNDTNDTASTLEEKWVRTLVMYDGFNALGIMLFCIAFGIFLSTLGPKGQTMVRLFSNLNDVISKMVYLVMWYSPVGIMSLIAGNILRVDNPANLISLLGRYVGTVLLGLAIHTFVILTAVYFLIVRKNPFRVLAAMTQVFSTIVGTSSSSATLPVTFRCLERGLGVDPRVTRFVLPIGATINKDGTALYEAVSAIFIAQLNDVSLNTAQVVIISLTATLASIGASTIPSAGLITMVIVLTAVGLPIEDIGLIFTIDWFLDRCRTCTNVFSDGIGACIVEHLSRKDLEQDGNSYGAMLTTSGCHTNSNGHLDTGVGEDGEGHTKLDNDSCMV